MTELERYSYYVLSLNPWLRTRWLIIAELLLIGLTIYLQVIGNPLAVVPLLIAVGTGCYDLGQYAARENYRAALIRYEQIRHN